jgi:ribose transport system ATP-binding protein
VTEGAATTAAAPPREGGAAAPLVEAVALEKHFGSVRALDGFSLAIKSGEVLALVGQNGAGKSTFVRALAGLEHLDHGDIRADGKSIKLRSHTEASRLGFTFVHQQLALVPTQTVEENLFLGESAPKRMGLVSRRRCLRAAKVVLERFDLQLDPRAKVAELSIADRWMLAIAKALVRRSRLLVLDEPTSSLSSREVNRLFQAVRKLRDDGVAVLYISHRLSEVEEIADRIVVCKDGRVVGSLRPGQATRTELIRMMIGREITEFAIAPPAERAEIPALEMINVAGAGVKEVSLTVQPGEIVGFAGLVGSGRTETAEIMIGHRRIEAGTINVNGKTFRPHSPVDSVARGIVLVPEERSDSLFMTRTIAQNVSISILHRLRLARWLPFISGRRERAIAQQRVRDLGIRARHVSQLVHELSGGNQQKTVLARWLSRGAEVFIFDEPTRGIDVEGKQQIYLLVDELAKNGAAVIFISSELPELIAIAHRMVIFREGRTVGELPRGASEEEILHLCYAEESA